MAIPGLTAQVSPVVTLTPTLTWGSVTGASSYDVLVTVTSSKATAFSANVLSAAGTSATTSALAWNTGYTWQVTANGPQGMAAETTPSATSSFTTVGIPQVMSLVSPTNMSSGEVPGAVTLSWETAANATSYLVQVATDGSFEAGTTVFSQNGIQPPSSGSTVSSGNVTGLTNGTIYYWRAGAKDQAGNGNVWAGVWSFVTTLSQPSLTAQVSPVVTLTPTLTWGSVTGASTYTVAVTSSDGTQAYTTTVSVTSALVPAQKLVWNGSYSWSVIAANGQTPPMTPEVSGAGTSSFTTVGIPQVMSLISPTNMSSNLSTTSVTLSWESAANATSYTAQVSTVSDFSTTLYKQNNSPSTTMTLTSLASGTIYYWRAGAKDQAGNGNEWAGPWSFVTTLSQPSLTAQVSPVVTLTPTLTWGSVTGASSYNVLVTVTSNSSMAFSATVLSSAGTSAATSALAWNTGYTWQVTANGPTAMTPATSPTATSTFNTVGVPQVLSLVSPSNSSSSEVPGSVTLSWETAANATSYLVQVATNLAFGTGTTVFSQNGIQPPSSGSTVSSGTVTGLTNGTVYYWRAGAKDQAGNGNEWAGPWSFTTIVGAPAIACPVDNAIDIPVAMTLSWNSTANATSYTVQLSTGNTFSTILDAQTLGTTMHVESGLSNSTKYFWRVLSSNPADGTSGWNVDSFTTITPLMTIPCLAGWNMISLNIRPVDSGIGAVIPWNVPGATNGFMLVKNGYGEAYIPSLQIAQLDTLQTGQGYQVYTQFPDTIRVQGSLPDIATSISLNKEWNLIAYLPQANMSIETEMAGISNDMVLVKDNEGNVYSPYFSIDGIGTMQVGQGYYVCMQSAASFTYPGLSAVAKRQAGSAPMLVLPAPRHYGHHENTGNNATIIASRVSLGTSLAPDSCEIGAYNAQGHLAGSGTVVHGLAAFAVWGANSQTGQKDGCGNSEKITFRLWNGKQEYPLTFTSSNGTEAHYVTQGILIGQLEVPEGALITKFDLSKVYPNPIKGLVKVEFDVPSIAGASGQNIEINVFDMKGSLIHQVAKGMYQPGHYLVTWNTETDRDLVGSGVYVIQMKGHDFEKRIKLVRIK
jgi:hypothetical protein